MFPLCYVIPVHAKSLQSCLTLCNPKDCSLPGSSVHGISQARILEWVAISSSRGILLTQRLNQSLSKPSASAGRIFTTSATWKAIVKVTADSQICISIYGHTHMQIPIFILLNDGGISHIHIYIYTHLIFMLYIIHATIYMQIGIHRY